mgnify:CR=1 FL=1
MRQFKNKETGQIATQVHNSAWYSIGEGDTKYQLPIWVLTEPWEFSINPWFEIKLKELKSN